MKTCENCKHWIQMKELEGKCVLYGLKHCSWTPSEATCDEWESDDSALPSADANPTMTEEVREALMRLTMCAREECDMCKYKDECGFDFQYKISTDNMNTLADALLRSKCEVDAKSAEAVQGDAISKRFISDAILQKISELNAQGEKAIPIAREFIRFKRFVDGLTPIRTEAVQGWIPCSERLPERDELVLVTYKTTDKIHLCKYIDDGSENPWWSYIDDCCACNNVVIAWMPLPKPYREDGEV